MLTPTDIFIGFSNDFRQLNHILIGEQLRLSAHCAFLFGVVVGTESADMCLPSNSVSSASPNGPRQNLHLRIPPVLFPRGVHLIVGFSYLRHRVSFPVYSLELDNWSWNRVLWALGLCIVNKAISFGFSFLSFYFKKMLNARTSGRKFVQELEDYKTQNVRIESNLASLQLSNKTDHRFFVFQR